MRAYRWLLHCFPREFREHFGRDMADVFADHRRAARRRGRIAAGLFIISTIVDTLIHAAAERRRQRRRRGDHMLQSFRQDIRFAIRAFSRRPAIAAAALVTMALGIGTNAAIFAVVRPLLLTPPPFPDPARVVMVFESLRTRPDLRQVANPSNFDAWEHAPGVFASVAGHSGWGATLTGAGDPVRLKMTRATASIFDVFGVRPALGRTFTAAEADANAHVVVISDALWRSRFGGDRGIVNRTIDLDGDPWRVTGIMPAGFSAPSGVEAWVPLAITPEMRQNRNTWFLQTVGRLQPGVTVDRATAVLTGVMERLAAEHPKFNKDRSARVMTWQDAETADVRQGLWMLQAVALMVLGIAGANLANLLLAHTAGRAREFAVRAAIGASRRTIARQLVTEGVVLALAGGAAGCIIAFWAVPAIAAMAPSWLPRAAELSIGWLDVAAAMALSVAAGALFSAVPAAIAVRRGVAGASSPSRTVTGSRGERLVRAGLITAQVALALTLLGGAGVLARSFVKLTSQPIGFDPGHVLAAELNLPRKTYPDADRRVWLFSSLVDQMGRQAGVVSAAASTVLPFTWWEWMSDFPVVGGDGALKSINTAYRVVTPDYFRTLDVPLKRGRLFTAAERGEALRVAVVNETFAQKYSALGDVIGAQLKTGTEPDDEVFTIIGVVGDTRHGSFARPAQSEMFLPLGLVAPNSMTLAIRTVGRPADVVPALRARLHELDAALPLNAVKPLTEWVGSAVAERRFYLTLLGVFASLALVLAVVGLYGVMAYAMRLRTREIGIRLALGATARGVSGMVVRQGLTPVAAGAAIGTGAFWFGTRVLQDQLFLTRARDPIAIGAAVGVLVGTAALACWLPARRSSRVDPAVVLRNE